MLEQQDILAKHLNEMEEQLEKSLSTRRFPSHDAYGSQTSTREGIYKTALECNANLDQIDQVIKDLSASVNRGSRPEEDAVGNTLNAQYEAMRWLQEHATEL